MESTQRLCTPSLEAVERSSLRTSQAPSIRTRRLVQIPSDSVCSYTKRTLRFLFALYRIVIPRAFDAIRIASECMIGSFPPEGDNGRNLERVSHVRDGFHP